MTTTRTVTQWPLIALCLSACPQLSGLDAADLFQSGDERVRVGNSSSSGTPARRAA